MPLQPNQGQPNDSPGELGQGFEAELNARLRADVDLQALVGGRIYPMAIRQKAQLPALVYAISGRTRDRTLNGSAGMTYATVHIDIRAGTYADLRRIAEVLRQYDRFRGTLARAVQVVNTILDDEADTYEWPEDSSARGTHHETLTFRFKYRDSLPVAP